MRPLKRRSGRRLVKEMLEARHLLTAEIEGFVWNDWSQDGHRAKPDQEYRVADVTVNLLTDRLELVSSTETDEEGVFEFSNAETGRYILEFVPPDDTVFTNRSTPARPRTAMPIPQPAGRAYLPSATATELTTSMLEFSRPPARPMW